MKKHTAALAIVLTTIAVSCGGSSSKSGDASSGTDGPASKSEFCTAFSEFKSASDELGQDMSSAESDPEAEKKAMEDFGKLISTLADKMISSAPTDLKDEAKLVADAMVKTFDLLESIDYDVSKVENDPALSKKFEELNSDPALEPAQQTLDAYISEDCGIDMNGTSESTDTSGGGDFCQTARQAISAQMMLGMLFDSDTPEKDSVQFAFGNIASLASQMLKNAPDDMRDNAKVFSDHANKIVDLLKSFDYDLTKAMEDPEFQSADNDEAANTALQAIQEKCGISLGDG